MPPRPRLSLQGQPRPSRPVRAIWCSASQTPRSPDDDRWSPRLATGDHRAGCAGTGRCWIGQPPLCCTLITPPALPHAVIPPWDPRGASRRVCPLVPCHAAASPPRYASALGRSRGSLAASATEQLATASDSAVRSGYVAHARDGKPHPVPSPGEVGSPVNLAAELADRIGQGEVEWLDRLMSRPGLCGA
jgi:hypothetical protein